VTCQPYQHADSKSTHSADKPLISLSCDCKQISADASKESDSDAPKWYAAFKRPEWALVLIGILTAGVIGWQSYETRKAAQASAESAEITQKQFVASNRPRIVIREVRLIGVPTTHPKVSVSFNIANAGSTPAQITESVIEVQKATFGTITPLPERWGFNEIGNNVHALFPLEPGSFVESKYHSEVTRQSFINEAMKAHVFNDAQLEARRVDQLIFIGRIRYKDANGVKRQMGFCRYYDFKVGRFRRLDDPDYDYED
jgi:hypothetical protein